MSNKRVQVALTEKALRNFGRAKQLLLDEVGENPHNSWARLELCRLLLISEGPTIALEVAEKGLN